MSPSIERAGSLAITVRAQRVNITNWEHCSAYPTQDKSPHKALHVKLYQMAEINPLRWESYRQMSSSYSLALRMRLAEASRSLLFSS